MTRTNWTDEGAPNTRQLGLRVADDLGSARENPKGQDVLDPPAREPLRRLGVGGAPALEYGRRGIQHARTHVKGDAVESWRLGRDAERDVHNSADHNQLPLAPDLARFGDHPADHVLDHPLRDRDHRVPGGVAEVRIHKVAALLAFPKRFADPDYLLSGERRGCLGMCGSIDIAGQLPLPFQKSNKRSVMLNDEIRKGAWRCAYAPYGLGIIDGRAIARVRFSLPTAP